jgi:macrodomain Ter protein organizer (MatP/YcbG family)
MKRIAVTLPEAIWRRMKVAAAQEGVTLSALLVGMFENREWYIARGAAAVDAAKVSP